MYQPSLLRYGVCVPTLPPQIWGVCTNPSSDIGGVCTNPFLRYRVCVCTYPSSDIGCVYQPFLLRYGVCVPTLAQIWGVCTNPSPLDMGFVYLPFPLRYGVWVPTFLLRYGGPQIWGVCTYLPFLSFPHVGVCTKPSPG